MGQLRTLLHATLHAAAAAAFAFAAFAAFAFAAFAAFVIPLLPGIGEQVGVLAKTVAGKLS